MLWHIPTEHGGVRYYRWCSVGNVPYCFFTYYMLVFFVGAAEHGGVLPDLLGSTVFYGPTRKQ